jgi:hypothetical protein
LIPIKPAEFAAFMRKDIARLTALAKARNIQFNDALRPFGVCHGFCVLT